MPSRDGKRPFGRFLDAFRAAAVWWHKAFLQGQQGVRTLVRILWIALQYCLPKRFSSRLAYRVARSQRPWLKKFLIRVFLWRFPVALEEAEHTDLERYASFNAFFTRALRPDARPLAADGVLAPVDGTLIQRGRAVNGTLMQAKGRQYSLSALLAHDQRLSNLFLGGAYATFYLSPVDYHRIHMPLEGTVQHMVFVPGQLFSVDASTTHGLQDLFARNERTISVFTTERGSMAVIMVGAMLVSSMETVWHDRPLAAPERCVQSWYYADKPPILLSRGAELGRFNMGSTVITLFEKGALRWPRISQDGPRTVRMGEKIAA